MAENAFLHLWSVPLYIPNWLPPLTDRMMKDAEKRLGVRLPAAYVQALSIQNGGYLRRRHHASGASIRSIDGISGNSPFRNWSEEKELMAQEGIDTIPDIDGLIPLTGDGHEYVCLDYRESGSTGEPCITSIDVESFSGSTTIAKNFIALIEGLVPDGNLHLGFATEDDLSTAGQRLGNALGVTFTDQGDDLYGYRIIQAQVGPDYGKEKRGEQRGGHLWISENRVARGFVRQQQRHLYLDRLAFVTGQALRYPLNPQCSITMTISPDTQASTLLHNRSNNLPYRPETLIA